MAAASHKEIARTIANQLGDKSTTEVVESLAAYLVAERRVNDLDKIMREVERIRHDEQGILEVEVASARALTTEIESHISRLFGEEHVQINSKLDKDLVGGVRIQAQDVLIDLSVRGQLNRLKLHNF